MSELSASLLRLKILDSLRAGEESKVDQLIQELNSVDSTVDTSELIKLRETILHYAVQIAPLSMIQHLVENESFRLDINAQDSDGNTPLHLAVAASRFNIVKYLLSLPDINDTVTNGERKQPVELAKDANIAQLMQYERAKFVEKSATELRKYFSERDFDKLEDLLVSNARASELLDINGADPETGNTVLHEFIRKEDYQMCDWILKHGGDPFKRDKRGKLPIDLVSSKSDPIRKLIKSASKDQNIMDPVASTNSASKTGAAPTYKGYLRKWTNFASGYKLRYFVLDQYGMLSYYTNQGDTNNACRGSLNLGYAALHLDSSEKLKFEIIGKNGIKWHLKANHPVETNRWVWTLQNAITMAKDNIKRKVARIPSRKSSGVDDGTGKAAEDAVVSEEEKKRRLLHIPGRRKHKKSPSQVSLASFTGGSDIEDAMSVNSVELNRANSVSSNHLRQIKESEALAGSRVSVDAPYSVAEDFDYDLEDSADSDSELNSTNISTSNEEEIKTSRDQIYATKRSLKVETASLIDLFKVLANKAPENDEETYSIGLKTLANIQDLIEQFDTFTLVREEKLTKKIERQEEVNKLWESSIRQLESEMQKHEEALASYEGKKYKLRKLLESKGISSPQVSNELAIGVGFKFAGTPPVPPVESSEAQDESALIEEIFQDSDDEFFDADEFDDATEEGQTLEGADTVISEQTKKSREVSPEIVQEEQKETNELPGKESLAKTDAQLRILKKIEEEGSFLGYEEPPRKKLAMDEDDRPKVGLWGILKSMIGKDMTRMTLPVSFNECTSLLQRLAEDIEYNDLLTTAAAIPDSTLRMVYVAAFAASEYASTIDRIAKPFNPLLGETFEYCRPDQNFRLISEQVSHHPPISACHAESIKWDYYGENAVDSQFRGRSFDFKHLGKMFCVIRPDSGVVSKSGERVDHELYSWKKVNTSVVGIIMGNPTVDNYGKMEVHNHTTGDVLQVDMKQRGWKASSAYQLIGNVYDSHGKARWAIGGHWNSRIYAKKVTGEIEGKRRDSLIEAKETSNLDPYNGKKFLVWEAAPRPKVPFNLTAFAVTLNGLTSNLKEYLAPTDTRLRPDQRAMEDGRYDEASNEKHRVEEKQRAARKKREQRRESYKPQWFVKLKHPVTGDDYWHYNDRYWSKRKDKQLSNSGDIF
ncbi:CIC11C00000000724 [Sungouiella intermedia]|uniref:CIC11C00000000724 n=1 Tax=Sungouiella intermedia TaxID=45354 RepID=A0A1L0BJF1_9ASCO|nr:CIC11C00000000724 [[Candida] intermedia]